MWTPITKPGAQTYTDTNPQGKEQYDQPSLAYDDPSIFYDGINILQWTDVLKPSSTLTWNDLPIAWQAYNSPWATPNWTDINKPS